MRKFRYLYVTFFNLTVSQNNIVRCSLGAACVSVINLILEAIGIGWTYVLLGGVSMLVAPIMFIIIRMGPKWRARERGGERKFIHCGGGGFCT